MAEPMVQQQGASADFGSLNELLRIFVKHRDFMHRQDEYVDDFIARQNSPQILRDAKLEALRTEKQLMDQLKEFSVLTKFLDNIILIENLFKFYYTPQQRQKQRRARNAYARFIEYWETKPKPISDVHSFVNLMAGTRVYLPRFKEFLRKVEAQCKRQGIKIVANSGAKGKNIERAFYKSFYVYAVNHGDNAFKQMTDVLRCSLVFDEFDDLYKCFSVIKEVAGDDEKSEGILRVKDRFNPDTMPFGYRDMLINIYCPGSKVVCEVQLQANDRRVAVLIVFEDWEALYRCWAVIEKVGGILRVKDRYNPDTMPFGYRDMLINIYCPGSKVVCEIQLHHVLFYRCKEIWLQMYKKARLFEDIETDENLAYKFADKEIRSQIGDKIYQLQSDYDDDGKDSDSELEKHEYEMTLKEVFEKYKGGLVKFVSNFQQDGYGEEEEAIHEFIEDLPLYEEIEEFDPSNKESWEELSGYGMKIGHIKKYKKMLTELKGKKDEWEKLKAKREKRKKKKKSAMQMPVVQELNQTEPEETKQEDLAAAVTQDSSKWKFEIPSANESCMRTSVNDNGLETLYCKAGALQNRWAAFGPMLSGSDKVKVVLKTSQNGLPNNYIFAFATPQWSTQQEPYKYDHMLTVDAYGTVHCKNEFKLNNSKEQIANSARNTVFQANALQAQVSISVDMQQRKAWITSIHGSLCVNLPESVRIVLGLAGSDEKSMQIVEVQRGDEPQSAPVSGGVGMLVNAHSNPVQPSKPQYAANSGYGSSIPTPSWNTSKSNPVQAMQPIGSYGGLAHSGMGSMGGLAAQQNQAAMGQLGGMFGMMGGMDKMLTQQMGGMNPYGMQGGGMGMGMGMGMPTSMGMGMGMGMGNNGGDDEDAFTNNLAQNIAAEEDQQFNQAYNSLYGNQPKSPADDENTWTWNADGREQSLRETYVVKKLDFSTALKFTSIVNGSFALSASVTTPSRQKMGSWAGFIGGPKGQFWMGLKDGCWCVGIQYTAISNFVCFKVAAPPQQKLTVTLVRQSDVWQLFIGDQLKETQSVNRQKCSKLDRVSIGAGWDDGKELWRGQVHSITLARIG
eukprot:CAMPEP_0197073794 /NCGR_PEP_ID=MMETSP1384-20130603/210787_1 /TAXON_ID=29189 /ORGANISM="Ammonia sp." /LENGTH=1068 /DNA_ID=CAMNT_0042512635 /DNA_START=26 /DNA_END=3233 /DNA_ORIENTATION=-